MAFDFLLARVIWVMYEDSQSQFCGGRFICLVMEFNFYELKTGLQPKID